MNVSGPAPIVSVQLPDDSALVLRLNQRLTAEVLQVSGDRVVLAVNGVQIVAKMTSMDQAAELVDRRQAQFVVKDLSASNLVLQLVSKGNDVPQPLATLLSELIPQLLAEAGLPVNGETTQIAQALLQAGLPLAPEYVNHMGQILSQINGWGQAQANILAALVANGLPVSPQVLTLSAASWPSLSELVTNLVKELKRVRNTNLPATTRDLLENSINLLDMLVIDPELERSTIGQQLRAAFQLLGNSVENQLFRLSQNGMRYYELPAKNENLLTLVLLRQALEKAGVKNLVRDLDTLLDAIRQMQFLNSEPETNPIKEQWLKIELPVALPDAQPGGSGAGMSKPVNARIHIAYLPDGERQIDPEHTRCVIRVELELKETVQVDITIADHRAGVQVATSTYDLLERAKEELPGLKSGLETLGYSVQSTQCRVEEFSPLEESDRSSAWNRFFEVRVEV